MKKLFSFLLVLSIAYSGTAQKIPAYTAADIIQTAASPDTIYIINFWATWCAPCVQELPEFNSLYERYNDKPVKIRMVSLDFREDYPAKLALFIKRKNLKPEVAWLMETDPNVFIPKIDESWQGSIPATLIIQPGHFRKFVEGQVTATQVSRVVDKLLEQ